MHFSIFIIFTRVFILLTLVSAPLTNIHAMASHAVDCHIEWATMRDGTKLATEIYTPSNRSQPLPVILMRNPYNGGATLADNGCVDTAYSEEFYRLAEQGYTVAHQDIRGTARSEGIWRALDEFDDGYDSVEWAARQPWSNGKVGLVGVSYSGFAALQAASKKPPHLVAVATMVTGSNPYNQIAYNNGVFNLWLSQTFSAISLARESFRRSLLLSGRSYKEAEAESQAWVTTTTKDGMKSSINYLPLSDLTTFNDKSDFYQKWLAHPQYDRYWKSLNIENKYDDITVPVLSQGGWYDVFASGSVINYMGLKDHAGTPLAQANSYLTMSATCHIQCGDQAIDFGAAAKGYVFKQQLWWWDHWLKGKSKAFNDKSPVNVFVMVPPDSGTQGSGFWINSDQYPLIDTRFSKFYLGSQGHANTSQGDGTLNTVAAKSSTEDSFIYNPDKPVPTAGGNLCCIVKYQPPGAYDQSTIEQRDDVLVYTSAPLTEDLTVIGPVNVKLSAISSATDTDFTAKLVDVHPDGYAQNILDGIIRARFREGLSVKPSLIKANQVYQYDIPLGHTATTFPAGHRIRLEVSSSNFPKYARNSNTGGDIYNEEKLQTAQQRILHGEQSPSFIILPIIKNIDQYKRKP